MQERRGTETPRLAHLYVFGVIAAAFFALAWAVTDLPLHEWQTWLIFTLMVAVTSLFPITVRHEHNFMVTPGLVQAAMLIWGPGTGVLTAAVAGLAASICPNFKRISPYKMTFNISSLAVAAMVHADLLSSARSAWEQGNLWGAPVVYLLAPLTGALVNTVLEALAIHLHVRAPFIHLLRSNTWVIPYWLVLWAIGAAMAFIYRSTGLFGIAVFLLPLFLVRYAFMLYVNKSKEAEAYVNDLRESNGKLAYMVRLLSVLHSGSVLLTSNLDPKLVPDQVRGLAVNALSFPHGGLFGLDGDSLRCLGAWRAGEDCADLRSRPIMQAARRALTHGVQEVAVGAEHWCLLPLVMNGAPVGVMCLGGDEARLKDNAGVLETFAAQVAAALTTSRLYQETRRMALTDALTGLANQRSMRDRLGKLMDQALEEGTPLSLVTLDLDRFKQINDRFGHPTGDRAIREVAGIIQSRLGPGDVAARNGGDEFALVLPGKQAETAREFMHGLVDAVARTELMHGKQRIPLSLSVGIATFPDHANTLPSLISRSDQAVYISKHTGRNRVTVWGDLAGVEDQLGQHWSWALDEKRESQAHTADPIKVMTAMVDARDGLTYGHSVRVEKYCAAVARILGLGESAVASISLGGLLHDVGKIGIPDAILNKPGPLSEMETEVVRQHPEIGAELMRRIGMPEELVAMVLYHHEFFDGSGYPAGLAGRDIPLGARIIAVCDAFEAITSRRPYKQPRPMPWAVEELRRCAGSQFDPEIVEVFVTRVLGPDVLANTPVIRAAASGRP